MARIPSPPRPAPMPAPYSGGIHKGLPAIKWPGKFLCWLGRHRPFSLGSMYKTRDAKAD